MMSANTSVASLADRPNFVIFLQDDQDYIGGRSSLRPLSRALAKVGDGGIVAENWFVHTPICCPSRAQLLSGRYFHNLRMPAGVGGGCMGVQTGVPTLEDKPNEHSFARYLVRDLGYTAGWLGKHMNVCPHDPPPGYDCSTCRWFANGGAQDTEPGGYLWPWDLRDFVGNKPLNDSCYSRNGSYSVWQPGCPIVDGLRVPQHGGYITSIIANKSIEWLHAVGGASAARDADGRLVRTFVLTVAPKAPHYAATPAPWYETGTWIDEEEVQAPRTPSFGVEPWRLGGHHAMIAGQGPLLAHERRAIDLQYRKRWKALLSVDEAIDAVALTLGALALSSSTYFFVTSDHGYNLGQHNLPSCKLNVYEHGIRVPMLIRGPGIAAGQAFDEIASHVDLAPTLLSLAGLDPLAASPPMDGKSLLPWLLVHARPDELPRATRARLALERAILERGANARLPRVRPFHWIEYYTQGNLTVCGGGSPHGSSVSLATSAPSQQPLTGEAGEAVILGSTCQADVDDPYGYCHMPCPHTRTGAVPNNSTCDLTFCVNTTCCGANHTQFSSLEGMRCGAGHAPGTLPFDSSADPGHQVDCDQSNTYRALRFVDPTPGGRGNMLYAEFTRATDDNFTATDIFVEIFDLDQDPGQMVNLANATSAADLEYYRATARKQFECAGTSCV